MVMANSRQLPLHPLATSRSQGAREPRANKEEMFKYGAQTFSFVNYGWAGQAVHLA